MATKNKTHYLVLDLGTTGIKALVFDRKFNIIARAYRPLRKYFPKKNWVEQKPQDLISVSKTVLKEAVKKSRIPRRSFAGLGITNQRETTILWDKKSGKPVYPAIVWEDTRTSRYCKTLVGKFEKSVRQKTGLYIDSYFSASKIRWILRNVKKSRELDNEERLLFGTVDTWVLWNLCSGSPHVTDHTNASRTLLFNIKNLEWDHKLSDIFGVSKNVLPSAKPSQSTFGNLKKDVLGFPLPVLAVCGDQQASLYALGNKKGTVKITYGTGTFIMEAIGKNFVTKDSFFTTLAAGSKKPSYALEGKIACCGKKVEPLLNKPKELQRLIEKLAHMVDGYIKKLSVKPKELIIDGGVTRVESLAYTQSRISKIPVKKQQTFDGTALGVAMLLSDHLKKNKKHAPVKK